MASTNKSSGEKTADALIVTGKGILAGVQLISDLTNDVTLIVYDNTAASGTKLYERVLDVSVEGFGKLEELPGAGVRADNGIYADVTGTGASYILYYR